MIVNYDRLIVNTRDCNVVILVIEKTSLGRGVCGLTDSNKTQIKRVYFDPSTEAAIAAGRGCSFGVKVFFSASRRLLYRPRRQLVNNPETF